jgi:hypothetical protein
MPDSTFVLNKQYWNATVACALDHGRDSGYEAVEKLPASRPAFSFQECQEWHFEHR